MVSARSSVTSSSHLIAVPLLSYLQMVVIIACHLPRLSPVYAGCRLMPETKLGSQPAWVLHLPSHEGMIYMKISIVCKEALMGKITQYYHATSLEDAFAKAKQLGPVAAYVGGGVELVLRRNPEITTLIDLSRCGLDYIAAAAEGIEIGSQTTLTTISRSADIRQYAG